MASIVKFTYISHQRMILCDVYVISIMHKIDPKKKTRKKENFTSCDNATCNLITILWDCINWIVSWFLFLFVDSCLITFIWKLLMACCLFWHQGKKKKNVAGGGGDNSSGQPNKNKRWSYDSFSEKHWIGVRQVHLGISYVCVFYPNSK